MSDPVDPATNLHLLALDRAMRWYSEQGAYPQAGLLLETADAFRDYVEYGTIPGAE